MVTVAVSRGYITQAHVWLAVTSRATPVSSCLRNVFSAMLGLLSPENLQGAASKPNNLMSNWFRCFTSR